MAWFGTTKGTYSLDEGIGVGPGPQPMSGTKWVFRIWKDGKYLEVARDLPGDRNTLIQTTPDVPKGRALLGLIGNRTSITTDKSDALQYTGGNWNDSGQNHQIASVSIDNFTITVPDTDTYRPKADISVELINALNGKCLQGKTTVKVTTNVTLVEGTQLSSLTHSFTGDSVTYTGQSFTKNTPFTSSGTKELVTTVRDTRGRQKTYSTPITVVAYSSPRVNAFTVQRCDSAGNLAIDGTYAKVTYDYSVYSVTGNTAVIKIQYLDGSTWTDLKTITDLTGDSSFITGNICPIDSDVQFRITVTDKFESITYTADIRPAQAWMGFSRNGNSMVLGRRYNSSKDAGMTVTARPLVCEDHVFFDKKLVFRTDIPKLSLIDLLHPVGSVIWLVDGKHPNDIFPGTTWVAQHVQIATPNATKVIVREGAMDTNGTKVILWNFGTNANENWKIIGRTEDNMRTNTSMWIRIA